MAKVTIGVNSQPQLNIALRQYLSELADIIMPIQSEAKFVGVSAEAFIPAKLAAEYELTNRALAVLKAFSDEPTRLMGLSVHDSLLQVMASALVLRRDTLASRLETVEADPLMPKEACSPLEIEIRRIDDELGGFWTGYGYSDWLPVLRERREMKLGLSFPRVKSIEAIIQDEEGQVTEFKESFPEQAHELAKEIAAFGTSNPGVILLGVDDNGNPVGLKNMRTVKSRDKMRARIEGISSNGIIPSLPIKVKFEVFKRRTIAVIEVPKGSEPVYYTKNSVPYIRHGSISRPALPQEVNELVKRHLERQSS